jgi:hypothetical protein
MEQCKFDEVRLPIENNEKKVEKRVAELSFTPKLTSFINAPQKRSQIQRKNIA